MRVHLSTGPVGATTQPSRGLLDRVRDFFSPTLTCEACGIDVKRYRCTRTGEVKTVPADRPVTRYTTIEVEYCCPECGGSVWFVDTSAQYPYPMF